MTDERALEAAAKALFVADEESTLARADTVFTEGYDPVTADEYRARAGKTIIAYLSAIAIPDEGLVKRLRYTATILDANKHKFAVPDHIPQKAAACREAADTITRLSAELREARG